MFIEDTITTNNFKESNGIVSGVVFDSASRDNEIPKKANMNPSNGSLTKFKEVLS
jgi:hypothetical protein|tara:strand:+ start:4650 stop:4814 length:165 start_codon:yes stop_codon:yes gene_type:complete